MKTFSVLALIAGLCAASVQAIAVDHEADSVQGEMEAAAIRYFVDNANDTTGLVRDRAANFNNPIGYETVASIAATGFALAVLSNAADRGLVAHDFAYNYAVKVLRFCRDSVSRHNGWFLHFIDWSTGKRIWNSEYSTIDTTLFLAGALYAAQVFPQTEVATITNGLYRDVDFLDVMTDGGSNPNKRTLSMAYTPEAGYTRSQWKMYAEEKLLLLLGLGHPFHPLPPEVWTSFSRDLSPLQSVTSVMGLNQALFVHQYSELYVDFRGFHDGYENYFSNGTKISGLHRAMADPGSQSRTFREGFWGLSAGDSPDGYAVFNPSDVNGTVCIGCAIGSAMFSRTVLTDAADWKNSAYPLWGRYGFIDSLNLDRGWFSQAVLGITVGPAYLSLANLTQNTSIWRLFMQIPEIQRALAIAEGSG